MEVISHSIEETKAFAQKVAEKLVPGSVLALYGDLGSGKTTFTSSLVEMLDIPARVQSPTFVIARRYAGGNGSIRVVNHVDLYRVCVKEEVLDLGLEELFAEEHAITVIEWPEVAEGLLPPSALRMKFEYVDESTRKINAQNFN